MRALIIALALTFTASLAHADVSAAKSARADVSAAKFARADVSAGTTARADIAWKVDRMGAGSMMVMKDRAGSLTHVKRGTQGAIHVFDVYAGQGALAQFAGSYKTNANGDVVETIAFDGATTRFVPHRCNRTVGECRFTMVHPDGFQEPRVRVTQAVRGGLEYREYGLDGLMTEGQMHLDADGAAKDSWQRDDKKDEQKQRTRRVLLALK